MIDLTKLGPRLLNLARRKSTRAGWATTSLIIVFALISVYYLIPYKRSITVVAETQHISNLTDGNPNSIWLIKELILCLRKTSSEGISTTDTGVSSEGDKWFPAYPKRYCSEDLYTEHHITEEVEFVWPENVQLSVRNKIDPDKRFVKQDERLAPQAQEQPGQIIEVFIDQPYLGTNPPRLPQVGDIQLNDKSLIVFPRASLETTSVLVLTGQITIGQIPLTDRRLLLRSGRFEIRESLPFRDRPILVNEGDLVVGDRLRVLEQFSRDEDGSFKPLGGAAFLTMPASRRNRGFSIVMTTQPAHSLVQIERAGNSVALISTNWAQRVGNDFLPAGISTLLGLFGASLGILRNFSRKKD